MTETVETVVENAIKTVIESEVKSETKVVEAEVVAKAKTAADLALEEVDKAKTVLYTAQQAAGNIAEKLIAEWKQKKEVLESEMKKLGVLVVQDAEIVEQKVAQALTVTESKVQAEVKKRPFIAIAASFVLGAVLGIFTYWKVR